MTTLINQPAVAHDPATGAPIAARGAFDPGTGAFDGTTSKSGPVSSPFAPSNVLALAGNGSAVVSWAAPDFAPPTGYTITASPGGAQTTVGATGRSGSGTITGLINGQAYSFTVATINLGGSSVQSAASNVVTPTALPSSILPVTRGLMFWFSAKNMLSPPANGVALATLPDLSGNGNAGVGSGGGGTWVANWSNGNPAVSLNGTNQCYTTPLIAGKNGTYLTAFLLFDAQTAAQGRLMSTETGGSSVFQSLVGSQFAVVVDALVPTSYDGATGYGAPFQFAAPAIVASTPTDAVLQAPGGFAVNGLQVAGSAFSPLLDTRNTRVLYNQGGANNVYAFGCEANGSFGKYLTCRLAEIILVNAQYSAAEIAAMRAYLQTLK